MRGGERGYAEKDTHTHTHKAHSEGIRSIVSLSIFSLQLIYNHQLSFSPSIPPFTPLLPSLLHKNRNVDQIKRKEKQKPDVLYSWVKLQNEGVLRREETFIAPVLCSVCHVKFIFHNFRLPPDWNNTAAKLLKRKVFKLFCKSWWCFHLQCRPGGHKNDQSV